MLGIRTSLCEFVGVMRHRHSAHSIKPVCKQDRPHVSLPPTMVTLTTCTARFPPLATCVFLTLGSIQVPTLKWVTYTWFFPLNSYFKRGLNHTFMRLIYVSSVQSALVESRYHWKSLKWGECNERTNRGTWNRKMGHRAGRALVGTWIRIWKTSGILNTPFF